jgi:hypothetical protein
MTVHFCSRQKLNFRDREKSNDDALCCTSPVQNGSKVRISACTRQEYCISRLPGQQRSAGLRHQNNAVWCHASRSNSVPNGVQLLLTSSVHEPASTADRAFNTAELDGQIDWFVTTSNCFIFSLIRSPDQTKHTDNSALSTSLFC